MKAVSFLSKELAVEPDENIETPEPEPTPEPEQADPSQEYENQVNEALTSVMDPPNGED